MSGEPLTGAATLVAELLEPDGAEVLARYVHPHLGSWAAVTTREVGAGRITVVGTVPDQTLAESLVRWLVPEPARRLAAARLRHGRDLDRRRAAAGCTSCTTGAGSRRPSPPRPSSATSSRDEEVAPGATLQLGAWDVRVFHQHQ